MKGFCHTGRKTGLVLSERCVTSNQSSVVRCVYQLCSRYITSMRGQLESQCSVPSEKCFLGDQRQPLQGKSSACLKREHPAPQTPPPPPPPPPLHGFHRSDCLICKDVGCRCGGDPVFWSFSSCGRPGLNMKVMSRCFIQDAGLGAASRSFCRLFPLTVKFTH